jgi:hypothetical protein
VLPPNCDLHCYVIIRYQVLFSAYNPRNSDLSPPLRLPTQRKAYSHRHFRLICIGSMSGIPCHVLTKIWTGGEIYTLRHPTGTPKGTALGALPHFWRSSPLSGSKCKSRSVGAHISNVNSYLDLSRWAEAMMVKVHTYLEVQGSYKKKQPQELKYTCLCWHVSNKIGNSELYIVICFKRVDNSSQLDPSGFQTSGSATTNLRIPPFAR